MYLPPVIIPIRVKSSVYVMAFVSIITITESEIGDCHRHAVHKRMQSIA